jgi:hypothetical protein
MEELSFESEELRQINAEWRRWWNIEHLSSPMQGGDTGAANPPAEAPTSEVPEKMGHGEADLSILAQHIADGAGNIGLIAALEILGTSTEFWIQIYDPDPNLRMEDLLWQAAEELD